MLTDAELGEVFVKIKEQQNILTEERVFSVLKRVNTSEYDDEKTFISW